MRRGAELQADQGAHLFEPQASLHETPAGPSTAGCPAAKRRGRRHQGRLLFAYFLLAKQEKVSRPPRRQSGIGLTREPRAQFNARLRQAQPERGGERARNSEAGVFGVRAQIPRAFGSPCGCCASLRSKIVIRPQKPGLFYTSARTGGHLKSTPCKTPQPTSPTT